MMFEQIKPDHNLPDKIMFRLSQEKRHLAKRHLFYEIIIGSLSILPLINLFGRIYTQLTQSGFLYYFSLLFSDSKAVFFYWR